MRHTERSFRYGPRLIVSGPLAVAFSAVATEMVLLAVAARTTPWRIVFGVVGTVATLVAASIGREVFVRLRGKRKIVVAARELVMPDGRAAIPFRDIRAMELRGEHRARRVLEIRHANGTLEIAGVMLGTPGELDEIHALIKAARKR